MVATNELGPVGKVKFKKADVMTEAFRKTRKESLNGLLKEGTF